ncbi:MAG: glycosyltransferase family 39 protein, partial [Desulfuromonadales bacterium]
MKLPGAAIVYALFMSIFGQNISSIRIGLILVNAACTGLLYLLGRRLFSTETAILAAVFYSLLSLSQSVMGIFAHATHFIVLFSLSGFIILRHGLVKRQAQTIFIGGICFGISFLMKQHAIVLIPFALLLQIWPQRKDNKILLLRDCFIFLIGSTVPYISVTLWLYNIGVFGNFWFWTVKYAIEYANGLSIAEGFNEFVSQITTIIKPNLLVWLLATAGIIVICRERKFRDERLFLIGYLAISFIMICPGLYFRPHYFVLLLPPIALLAAFATTSAIQTLARTVQPKWATATLILFLIITPS